MNPISALRDIFYVQREDIPLATAQVRAIGRQIPTLYAVLSLNAIAVCYIHYGVAPDWLTVWPLGGLLVLCAKRMVDWALIARRPPTGEAIFRRLHATNVFAAVLGIGFAVWGLLLTGYGDVGTRMHVLFFLTITMIICVHCLAHLRSAATIVGAIALPLTVFFILRAETVVSVAALNYAGVIIAMMFMQSFNYRDFRRLVRLGEENRVLAHTDTLTGLPNRRSFFARLQTTIERNGAQNGAFSIGVIDLDGFKPVNDSFGHHAGDAVLCEVGRRVERAMEGVGWAARLGGDEFGLIIEGTPDLEALGGRLCASLAMPYTSRDATARIGASIGFAVFPDDARAADSLVERADYALYHAKTCHRGRAVIFAPEHEVRLRSHAVIEQALRRANIAQEFTLVFQPIVDVVERRIATYEALARWHSPTLGEVSPADFIEIAERSGLICDLSRTLFAKALRAMRAWPADVRLSFNLSAHDIASVENLVPIIGLIETSGIRPSRVVFEVTETGLMRDVAEAGRSLQALRDLGVDIAIDDFGTGYSSLSYVHKLPISKLKIDRSFVTNLGEDAASLNIIRSIVDLCRHLDLRCVVEGVETEDEMNRLRAAGCRLMQGYLFHSPMPEADIEAFHAKPLCFDGTGIQSALHASRAA